MTTNTICTELYYNVSGVQIPTNTSGTGNQQWKKETTCIYTNDPLGVVAVNADFTNLIIMLGAFLFILSVSFGIDLFKKNAV